MFRNVKQTFCATEDVSQRTLGRFPGFLEGIGSWLLSALRISSM